MPSRRVHHAVYAPYAILVKRSLCLWLWTQPDDCRLDVQSMDCRLSTGSRRGRGGIRTHEAFTPACFQDKCLRPLGNAPMTDGGTGLQYRPAIKFHSLQAPSIPASPSIMDGLQVSGTGLVQTVARGGTPLCVGPAMPSGAAGTWGRQCPGWGSHPHYRASAVPDAGATPRSPGGALSG